MHSQSARAFGQTLSANLFANLHSLMQCCVVKAALATLTILLTWPAFSQETASFAQLAQIIYHRCGEKEGFPGGIAFCVYEEEGQYGKLLADEYNKALRGLTASTQARLRESQRAWLMYQKTYCDLLRDLPSISFEGLGFAALARANCLLRTTLQRLDEVRAISRPYTRSITKKGSPLGDWDN